MLEDLRYAARQLTLRPGFTAVAVLTLALGIGANTAIFSVVNGVLLRPLPYPEPDRLVRLYGATAGEPGHGNLSPLDFLDLGEQSTSFQALSAFASERYTWVGAGDPSVVQGLRVTPGYFDVAGVAPVVGRAFTVEEGRPGAPPLMVLGDHLWRTTFGGDPVIVGQTVAFEEGMVTIVGIAPASFVSPGFGEDGPQFWTNFRIDPERHGRGGHWVRAVGRLHPEATIEQAQAELDTLMVALEARYPDSNSGERVAVVPLLDSRVGDVRPVLLLLLGAVGFVLLIACSNVANLFLARAIGRSREVAIRAALGASRGQLIRALLIESTVLGLIGGVLGLGLAVWGVDGLLALGGDLPRTEDVTVDARVLVFALGVSLLTGMLFGLVPAVRVSSPDLVQSLKEGARTFGGARHRRERQVLVVIQVALALMLVTGAGLFARSFWRVLRVDPGFRPDGVLSLQVSLPENQYDLAARAEFFERAQERLSTLPGVEAVGIVNALPLTQNWSCDGFSLDDRPPFDPGEQVCAESRWATPGYFAALGIPLLEGRLLEEGDGPAAERSVVINRAMARRFWPAASPLGRRLTWGGDDSWTVVGVVGDVRHFGLDRDVRSEVYMPYAPGAYSAEMYFALRAAGQPDALMPAVRRELSRLDPRLPLTEVSTLERAVAGSVADRRFNLVLLVVFAGVALVLALIGVYGVMSCAVNERVREIGLRVALGAGGADIYRMVLGQGVVLAGIGVAVGIAGALALGRLLTSMLFGVAALDPPTFIAVPLLVATVVLAACLPPAWRATRIDPLTALREE